MAGTPSFEFPSELRELTDRNIGQVRAAYHQFIDAMAEGMSMWTGALPGNSGFKSVQDRTVRFAKQNADACFALASELANAKDVTDMMAIQSRYAQTQLQTYALQAQELGRLTVEAAQSIQSHR